MTEVQCKKCRYLLKDKDGYNWCPNKLDDPDVELLRNCEWYVVKTNADRIRSMSDEELAELLRDTQCNSCAWQGNDCDYADECKAEKLEMLKQECDENGT